MTTRVHQLAQAAQVGDLLADRAEQLLEQLEHLDAGVPTEVFEQVRTNLERALGAYRSVRP